MHIPLSRKMAVSLCAVVSWLLATTTPTYAVRTEVKENAGNVPANIVQVVAPNARLAAVSDEHGILILSHRGEADRHLSVHRIDSKGNLAAEPQLVMLPTPDNLKTIERYALGIDFHPTLPLVYVWQDLAANAQQADAVYAGFDHLVIYEIKDGKLTQLGTLARGDEFAFGQGVGALTVSGDGQRVFMPNLQDRKANQACVGYYDLDDKGMPEPSPVPIPGSLDGFGVNKFDMQMVATKLAIGGTNQFPTGWGFVAPTGAAVTVGWHRGGAVWDTENRRAQLGMVYIEQLPTYTTIRGDAALPVVFGAVLGYSHVWRMYHADGFLTGMPQYMALSGAALQSPPVVMPGKVNRLAVGERNKVYVFALDANGMFTGTTQTYAVNKDNVHALAYSKKHDRLYVGVTALPEEAKP